MLAIFHPHGVSPATSNESIYENEMVTIWKSNGYPMVGLAHLPGGFCVVYGEIYNGKDVFHNSNGWEGSLASSIGTRILNRDFNFLKELNGSFSIVCFDERSDTLYAVSDRYGSHRFYYGKKNGNIYVFPGLTYFGGLGFKPVIDENFLLQFLTFRYLITDQTLFQDVFLMPQSSVLEIDPAGYQFHQYWDWHLEEDNPLMDEDEIIRLAGPTWIHAVESRVAGKQKVAVPLSGGLDSRAILAAMLECKKAEDIITFTGGTPGSLDYEIGRMVARSVGVRNVSMDHTLPKDYAGEYERRCVETDGMVEHVSNFFATDWERIASFTPHVMSGFMGDSLGGSRFHIAIPYKHMQLPVNKPKALEKIFEQNIWVNSSIVTGLLNIPGEDYHSQVLSLIESGTQNNPQRWKPNFCNHWNFRIRQRNFINPSLFTQRPHYDYLLPFLDNDWVDLALRVSPTLRWKQLWYQDFLTTRFHKLYKFPVTKFGGRPIKTGWLRDSFEKVSEDLSDRIASIPGTGASRVAQFIQELPGRYTLRHFHPEAAFCRRSNLNTHYSDFNQWFRGGNPRWAGTMVSSISRATRAGLASNEAVKNLLDSQQAGLDSAIAPLTILASLGWILEIFDPQVNRSG